MSYDLIGVRPRNGETVEKAVERLEELAEDETPPTDAEWDRMLAIGDALQIAGPVVDRHEDRERGVVELTTERLQVSVLRDEAGIGIPYWSGGRSDPGMTQAARYVSILASAGGFTIWDPQEEHIVTPDAAPEQVAKGYAASARVVLPGSRRAAEGDATPVRRRWQFWKR